MSVIAIEALCPDCNRPAEWRECLTCDGTGSDGIYQRCPDCDGQGRWVYCFDCEYGDDDE